MREQNGASCAQRPCAYFDFDDTLIEGDSVLYWLRFYYEKRPTRRVFQIANLLGLMLYLVRVIDEKTLKRIYFLPMSFEDELHLDALAREFVRERLSRYFYGTVLDRLWAHHRLGHEIVIVSASAEFYLRYLSEFLPPCTIIGTRFDFPQSGWRRLPRFVGGNVKGENKLRALERCGGIPAQGAGCFAYSDHHSDKYLLEMTEFPCCVLPGPLLRRIARPRGWPHFPFPHRPNGARSQLVKLLLVVLAWIPRSLDPALRHDGAAAALAPASWNRHRDELKALVSRKYLPETYPDIHARLFPEGDRNRGCGIGVDCPSPRSAGSVT